MSTARTAPAVPWSKVEQSRLVLAGTAAIVSTVLIIWLLLAPRFAPKPGPSRFFAAALAAPEALPGASSAMAEDGRGLVSDAKAGADGRELGNALAELVKREGNDPVVIYLAAVGVSAPDDAERNRVFLMTIDGPNGSKTSMVPATELLGKLQGKKGPPKLLILDAGRVGSDRELGVFGNGFLAQLPRVLSRDGNLVVLTSCAPGQVSWTADPGDRSIFARYVAEGLSGKAAGRLGRVTASSLHQYVLAGVSRWAEKNRDGAIQTPMLLGNESLGGMSLARRKPITNPAAPVEKIASCREKLKPHWEARAALARRSPSHHAPLAWRRYQDALLRAERLFRAHDFEGADKALGAARDLKTQVERLAPGPALPRPHALALLSASNADGQAASYRQAMNQALSGMPDTAGEPVPPPIARPGEPPAAEAVAKPKTAAPKEKTESPAPAVEAVSRRATALDGLTGGVPDGPPTFVEGQTPLWYASFVAIGGETEPLKRVRTELLHRAAEVRVRAEQVAADPRSAFRVRDLMDLGDAHRRTAQDRLFAGEEAAILRAKADLERASQEYEHAAEVASRYSKAADLVERLQDELPYYGEWQVHQRDGSDDSFQAFLADAAELSKLVDGAPAKGEDAAARLGRLKALTDALEPLHRQLINDFQSAVDRATAKLSSQGWRDLDALLRVPMIAAEDRLILLDNLASPDRSPALDFDPAAPSQGLNADPDPAFWKRARGLARLEAGLLSLAGTDATELFERAAQGWKAHETNPEAAFDAFDRFSARVRALRTRAAAAVRGETGAADRSIEDVRVERLAADRGARALPASALANLSADPTRRLDEFRLHALLVWHAQRLDDDFSPSLAQRLLGDAWQFAITKDLSEESERAGRLADAGITVKGQDARTDLELQRELPLLVSAEPEVPPGEAVLLLAHHPETLVEASVKDGGSLIPVPTPTGRPEARTLLIVDHSRRAAANRFVGPAVFFRGREFAAQKVALPDQVRLVKVEVRQHKRYGKYPDVFVINNGKGFLHSATTLDYKIVVTNLTDKPINVLINDTLEGLPPSNDHPIRLGARQSDETVWDTVRPNDLSDDKPKVLTVTVVEDGADGRPLCKPLLVPFRKVHPKEFMKAGPGIDADVFTLIVTHERGPDPVPLPVLTSVTVEPAEAFREIGNSIKKIERGDGATFRFQILKPVKKVKWTLNADATEKVAAGEFVLFDDVPKEEPPIGDVPKP